jgi:VWFA-related protein
MAAAGQAPAEKPVDLKQAEQVDVRLVLVDVLVTDRAGRTVPGLARADFTLLVQNRPVEIDTMDAACDSGALPDPAPRSGSEARFSLTSSRPARTVLLFDHYHMDMGERLDALASAREIVAGGLGPGDEMMVAVLTDGLRVLAPFTSDRTVLSHGLDRLEQDVTIWAKLFDPPYRPLTESGYFRDISRLMNVLAGYEGAKAVVLFSSFLGRADDNDLWYLDVAHRAAESRSVIYPVYARGLEPPQQGRKTEPTGGSRALARLANETGGRFTRLTNDLSLGYARARRDLDCRYTLGFYLKETGRNEVEDTRNIVVRVQGRSLSARHPERLREWPVEDRRAAAVQAAESNPERYLDLRITAGLELLKPKGERSWKVRLKAQAPPPAGEATVAILVSRDRRPVKEFRQAVPAGRPLEWDRTLKLATGDYELIVVLDDPVDAEPSASVTTVTVPPVTVASPR